MKKALLFLSLCFLPTLVFAKKIKLRTTNLDQTTTPGKIVLTENKKDFHILTKIVTSDNLEEAAKMINASLKELKKYGKKNKIIFSGPPRAIVYKEENGQWTTSTGYKIQKIPEILDPSFTVIDFKKGKVLKLTHKGAYKNLPEAYANLTEWALKNNLKIASNFWEIYSSQKKKTPEKDLKTVVIVLVN